MGQWWSWVLTAVGVTGLYYAGSGRRLGWAIGVGAQFLWIAYAVATRQWGFIVSALAYGTVNTRNLVRQARKNRAEHEERVLAAYAANAYPHADRGVVEGGPVSYVRGTAGVPLRGPEKL